MTDAARVMAAIRATWPPGEVMRVGAFDLPLAREGTRRGTAIRPRDGAEPSEADIAAVEAARPDAVFGAVDGDGLARMLEARGYAPSAPNDLMAGPVAALPGDLPRVSGFPHWPPLAICEAFWDAHGNDAVRRAPMHRAPEPRAAILLRAHDRAAGALFAGIHDGLAVLHLVVTLPQHRRKGVGMLGLRHAASWAAANGADTLALPVEASNEAAIALYSRAGLSRVGGYRYWSAP